MYSLLSGGASCRYSMVNERSARFSVHYGSCFFNTHLSLHQILRAAYYRANHPSSTLTIIQTEANIHSRTTIIDYYNYFRDICQEWALRVQVNERLRGLGRVIEVDESKLFHAKYNRGDMLRRTYDWVFGLLERGTNKVRFFHVVDRTAATLLPIIAANVEPGSTIVSDGWAAYGGVNNLQQQYTHRWVNHNLNFVDATNPMVHTRH